ncbi:MAG: hypothetical protein L6V81_02840 [Clostridium sp.]|nr:MAG: hypothetical protein L6V81_02840 [Clostridium sp.]
MKNNYNTNKKLYMFITTKKCIKIEIIQKDIYNDETVYKYLSNMRNIDLTKYIPNRISNNNQDLVSIINNDKKT